MIVLTQRLGARMVAFTLMLVASCTDAERCRLGTLGCYCDEGTCEAGGTCVAGTCEPCVGQEECPCRAGGGCDNGLTCVTSEDRCVPTEDTVCEDTCHTGWIGDGACDDGGEGAEFSSCYLGTDCTDCGARRNPCTNPSFPRFCPRTPNFPSECWSDGVDCDTITYCGGTTPLACLSGFRYDCDSSSCVANACAGTTHPVFCAYEPSCTSSGTDCCFTEHADCDTVTECFGGQYACITRRSNGLMQVSCGASESEVACVLAP
ncbi:MAG: hypothetical protein KC668_11465 [Myxococcales bacterium]|nr:hypothetical protein [Myxococcales bacterium]